MMLRILEPVLILILLGSQFHPSLAGRKSSTGSPLHVVNPFGVFHRLPARRRSIQHQRPRLSSPWHQQHLQHCNTYTNTNTNTSPIATDNHDDDHYDELTHMRSLVLSSRDERSFFTQTDTALLRKSSKSRVLDCAAVASTAKAALMTTSSRPLVFWENMVCGAISRSIAQTVMHPANTMKTILQSERVPPSLLSLLHPSSFKRLSRGAGANFILSVPHGAVNFAVLEFVRDKMNRVVQSAGIDTSRIGPGLDFCSSAVSTICCSIVSTPQMMITDNIMAGNYPNLMSAVQGLYSTQGIKGFYSGWFPGLVGKIPSYALTWTLFQQLKNAHRRAFHRDPLDVENSIMGCLASATTVCVMIPIDTIKTRLVTQASMAVADPYTGIINCAVRVYREEGLKTFYRGLPPRLVSVVPMIGIQFGVYEFMKRVMQERSVVAAAAAANGRAANHAPTNAPQLIQSEQTTFQETMLEVAADTIQPFPAPQFRFYQKTNGKKSKKNGKK